MADSRSKALIIQFSREPVPGQVKTRMLSGLSAAEACQLHCELVLWTCGSLVDSALAPVQLCVAGDATHGLFAQCQDLGISEVIEQRGADLGERMYLAMSDALQRYQKVIVVGSDCPALDSDYLSSALEALDRVPVVLGPAEDGGYVLIAATRIDASLFAGVSWGSDRVLSQTRERLEQLCWDFEALGSLADVDRPEDVPAWEKIREGRP